MPSDVEETPEVKEWEDNTHNGSRWSAVASWQGIKSLFVLCMRSLLAALLLRSNASAGQPEKKLRPTAYLDGLRGFAAFLVYWHHHTLFAHPGDTAKFFENGFGHEGQYYLVALPYIRNFITGGHFAVSTFYVISGYVLTTKPISLVHAGEQAKLADNLSSALFRRWLRLYIPLIATTFLYLTFWHLSGAFIAGSKPKPTYREELWAWYCELKNFSFVFNQGGEPWFSYNFHLWSIPVEFKGSIVVYTATLAFSRCSRNARLWLEVGLILYFLYIADGWYCALFCSGMLLSDLDLLAAKEDLPSFFERFEKRKSLIYYILLLISLYLGGVPSANSEVKNLAKFGGWHYLSYLKPQAVFDYKWFYLFWAATLLVAAIPRIPWLRRFFETRFCQYLGRISFALYLVHGPVIWVLADRVYALVGWEAEWRVQHLGVWLGKFPLPKIGPAGLEVAFLLPHVVLLPVTLYVAEVVTRLFDEPSVQFPLWFYKKTLGKPSTPLARLPA